MGNTPFISFHKWQGARDVTVFLAIPWTDISCMSLIEGRQAMPANSTRPSKLRLP